MGLYEGENRYGTILCAIGCYENVAYRTRGGKADAGACEGATLGKQMGRSDLSLWGRERA